MHHLSDRRTKIALAILLVFLGSQLGCRSFQRRGSVPCRLTRFAPVHSDADRYMKKGALLEREGSEHCVDWYYAAARLKWQSAVGYGDDAASYSPVWEEYNDCVAALLYSAAKMRRLDASRGLVVHEGTKQVVIPVVHHGFPWEAHDFQSLSSPPCGRQSLLTRRYEHQGVGVPLVVERKRNDCFPVEFRFYPEKTPFAATAILRFDIPPSGINEETASGGSSVLEFHNPLTYRHVQIACARLPIASDLTAPLAHTLEETPRTYFAGFVLPGQAENAARLQFQEPYQPGKIPVVIIHGLFSDPQSWADLVNDLRAAPGFADRFQLWDYRYPTGQGFLQSAATLRAELQGAIDSTNPDHTDPALQQMVLIGHSMGGLMAKVQVTYSDERIWEKVANRPLEEIVASEETRAQLARICYFDPSPHVKRVVFIATPHCGSLAASQAVGRGASSLVRPSEELTNMQRQLLEDNPDTFSPLVQRRFPTSIDLLKPSSPLLEAMRQMRVASDVKLHNVIGKFTPISADGPSDGIVSMNSAEHPGCQSRIVVGAAHGQVHRQPPTTFEILRILELHWQESSVQTGEHLEAEDIPVPVAALKANADR